MCRFTWHSISSRSSDEAQWYIARWLMLSKKRGREMEGRSDAKVDSQKGNIFFWSFLCGSLLHMVLCMLKILHDFCPDFLSGHVNAVCQKSSQSAVWVYIFQNCIVWWAWKSSFRLWIHPVGGYQTCFTFWDYFRIKEVHLIIIWFQTTRESGFNCLFFSITRFLPSFRQTFHPNELWIT